MRSNLQETAAIYNEKNPCLRISTYSHASRIFEEEDVLMENYMANKIAKVNELKFVTSGIENSEKEVQIVWSKSTQEYTPIHKFEIPNVKCVTSLNDTILLISTAEMIKIYKNYYVKYELIGFLESKNQVSIRGFEGTFRLNDNEFLANNSGSLMHFRYNENNRTNYFSSVIFTHKSTEHVKNVLVINEDLFIISTKMDDDTESHSLWL